MFASPFTSKTLASIAKWGGLAAILFGALFLFGQWRYNAGWTAHKLVTAEQKVRTVYRVVKIQARADEAARAEEAGARQVRRQSFAELVLMIDAHDADSRYIKERPKDEIFDAPWPDDVVQRLQGSATGINDRFHALSARRGPSGSAPGMP